MKKDIILVGGGGHCKACIDVIELTEKFNIIGIIDKKEHLGKKLLSYKIFANDDNIPELIKNYDNFLITVGQIKDSLTRVNLYRLLKKYNASLPIIISPKAYVSKHSFIEEGTIVMHNAFINAGAKIGKNCIINSNAIIEHDSNIGDFCHISTGCIVNGNCVINNNVFLGSNSVLKNNVKVMEDIIIGAGSVVTKDITDNGVYVGNPAKIV